MRKSVVVVGSLAGSFTREIKRVGLRPELIHDFLLMVVTTKNLRHLMFLIPLRRTPTLHRCCPEILRSSRRACFSTGNLIQNGARGPSIVMKQRGQIRQQRQIPRSTISILKQAPEYEKWPLAVFMAAEQSGALSITSQRAVTILEDFQALGSRPVQEFCTGG